MKRIKVLIATLVIATITTFPACAEWRTEEDGRKWYQNEDGSYPENQWQEIDGKQYYFDAEGYMLANTTTPDGKQVGEDGALAQAPLFDFEIGDSRITYTGWKIKYDYKSHPCVGLYYNFTNKQAEPQSAISADYIIKVFQNGIECDSGAISYEATDEPMNNYYKDIMQGVTINVADYFKIQDRSDITIQIKEMWNWSNPKTQTVTLKIQ